MNLCDLWAYAAYVSILIFTGCLNTCLFLSKSRVSTMFRMFVKQVGLCARRGAVRCRPAFLSSLVVSGAKFGQALRP